ncbi:Dpb4 [Kluyveromyces lactis]|nr:Dpb4 [Kluyveromyces lactis]
MPPKGWRKDSEGNYPNTSYIKEQEKISIDDLLFPKSIITSLAKESLQNAFQKGEEERRITVSKDAALAMQRSATVFVNHLLMFARMNAKDSNRKSCNDQDIMAALDTLGLGALKSILTGKMQEYQEAILWKKQNKVNNAVPGADGDIAMEDDEDDDDDDDDGREGADADAESKSRADTEVQQGNAENDKLDGSPVNPEEVPSTRQNDLDSSTKKQKTE